MRDRTYVAYIGQATFPSELRNTNKSWFPASHKNTTITKLVWCEPHSSILAAIPYEKEIKGWPKSKKGR